MATLRKIRWNYGEVLDHFESKDVRLARLMKEIGPIEMHMHTDHFTALVESIISQQLSVKAADTIYKRLVVHCGGALRPDEMAVMNMAEFRIHGISGQKAGYLIDLARHFRDDPERFTCLGSMSDGEVTQSLVEIKGIGTWTAQMFLMFTLSRMDVFAPGDLGLRNAMMALYKWKEIPDKDKMERKAKAWAPYRTIACRYLWKTLKNG